MSILTRDEAKKVLEKVLNKSKADHCTVSLDGSDDGNIRYARNTVSTSGFSSDLELGISSAFGNKTGVATTNEITDEAIEKMVRRSEELAKLSPENPEFMEPLPQQKYLQAKTWDDATAKVSADYRANAANNSILVSKKKEMVAAGFLEDSAGFSSMMNSKGLFAYEKETYVDFTLTARSPDGKGSGWVQRDYNDISKLDTERASAIAVEKAAMSRGAKAIEPGKYTVILEPNAANGLLRTMFWNMSRRSADEGRSFMTKKGGGNKLGEKMFDERISVVSDPLHPIAPGYVWSDSGLAQEKTTWIENGVIKNLHCGRFWADKQGVAPMPYPSNQIFASGDASVEDMIKNTKKGILVTRLWYIRSVDPQTLLYTGLTRDGTFYIENGKIKHPVKNFRFNESPIIMLNNLETLGKTQRVNGNMIPALKIRDFTFTSLSDAI